LTSGSSLIVASILALLYGPAHTDHWQEFNPTASREVSTPQQERQCKTYPLVKIPF
jgi:hypothetical protein